MPHKRSQEAAARRSEERRERWVARSSRGWAHAARSVDETTRAHTGWEVALSVHHVVRQLEGNAPTTIHSRGAIAIVSGSPAAARQAARLAVEHVSPTRQWVAASNDRKLHPGAGAGER